MRCPHCKRQCHFEYTAWICYHCNKFWEIDE